MEKNIIKELKGTNIDFTDKRNSNVPTAFVKFSKLKTKYEVEYGTVDAGGKIIIPLQKMYFKKGDGVGKELALRLFGIGGPVEFEGD